jgi:hypothetical protein
MPEITGELVLREREPAELKLAGRPDEEAILPWLRNHARAFVVLHTSEHFRDGPPLVHDKVYLVLNNNRKIEYPIHGVETRRSTIATALQLLKDRRLPVQVFETSKWNA